MTTDNQHLGIELRFRPMCAPEGWARALASVISWEPRLRPIAVTRLEDPDQRVLPWTDALAAELSRRCAELSPTDWLLTPGPAGAITVSVRNREVAYSLALPRPSRPLPSYLLDLIRHFHSAPSPAIAMLFDLGNTDDGNLVFQGLHSLMQAPPYLYLDAAAVSRLGGHPNVREVVCEVIDGPQGGLLLITRSDPWQSPTVDERARSSAVEHHLGMGPGAALVLADDHDRARKTLQTNATGSTQGCSPGSSTTDEYGSNS